jgi:hypothetical protein
MKDKLSPDNNDIHNRGKTIRNLIQELLNFEDLDTEVKVSFDYGKSFKSVGLVTSTNDSCILIGTGEEEKKLS